MARPAIRGAATASPRRRLPNARFAQRGRRRRPGRLSATQPRRHQRRREPPRLADDGCRARRAEHAPLAQDAARAAARRARSRPDRRSRRRHRPRARGAARRLGRPGAADRARDADLSAQWEVVEAFIAAAREGEFDALVAVLDPDVVLRADGGLTGPSRHVRGAEAVAGQALLWSRVDLTMRRVLVNGAAGIITFLHGRPFSIAAVTVKNGKLAEIDFLADPERIARLDLTELG